METVLMASLRDSEFSEPCKPPETVLTGFQGGHCHLRPADIPYTRRTSGPNSALWELLRASLSPGPAAAPSPGGDDPFIQVPSFISLSPAPVLNPQAGGRGEHLALSWHVQALSWYLENERMNEPRVLIIPILQLGNRGSER